MKVKVILAVIIYLIGMYFYCLPESQMLLSEMIFKSIFGFIIFYIIRLLMFMTTVTSLNNENTLNAMQARVLPYIFSIPITILTIFMVIRIFFTKEFSDTSMVVICLSVLYNSQKAKEYYYKKVISKRINEKDETMLYNNLGRIIPDIKDKKTQLKFIKGVFINIVFIVVSINYCSPIELNIVVTSIISSITTAGINLVIYGSIRIRENGIMGISRGVILKWYKIGVYIITLIFLGRVIVLKEFFGVSMLLTAIVIQIFSDEKIEYKI